MYRAAEAHGLVGNGADLEAGWAAIDDVASSVFGKDAGTISSEEWITFAAQIAAGTYDPPPAPSGAITP